MKNNRIVVDLNKVQYAWQSWVTVCGNYKRTFKPEYPTVHGREFDCNAPAFGSYTEGGFQTMLHVARAKHLLDIWIPCTTLQLTANHRLTYTGAKAESIWSAWCSKQFKGKK